MTATRTDAFVPLISTAMPSKGAVQFQATVITQAQETQKFHSIDAHAAAPGARANCEPRVTVQRDGERVVGIHIQCSCGQIIDLACVYDAAPVAAKPSAGPTASPQPEIAPSQPAPGNFCKDSGKDLPTAAPKEQKKPGNSGGTPTAKQASA